MPSEHFRAEGLSAYIPEDRRQAIARGERLPDRTTGAALFADLSGFTPMTEALTRAYGPHRGAEELTRQLGLVFGALIRQVDEHRGSVIGFSGDAITCWFDGDDGLRATAASLAMQEAMAPFAEIPLAGGERASLRVKTAVVTGPVRRFLVGDPDIQVIDAVAGATLDLLAEAERWAESGEVVVADTVAPQGGPLVIREWRESSIPGRCFGVVQGLSTTVPTDPWPALGDDTLEESELASWLLPGVYERIREGLGAFLADFRPAAALFLSFHGIDYDNDDAAGEKLDRFVRWLQARVAAYEGSVVQLTIGDKGSSYVYVSFGAPIAHDDDAARAVAVALEIRTLAPGLEFVRNLKIGVTHGQMYAGAYGSPSRRTYGVLGAKTNLSARLMGKAEAGQILSDEEIARRAGRAFTFQSLGVITVKGKVEGIEVFTPLGRVGPTPEDASDGGPLIGRQRDLSALLATFDDVLGGVPRVSFLEGEAGIGKSRLLQALVQRLRERATHTYVAGGQSGAQQAPYRVWRDLFMGYFGLAEGPNEERRRHQVTAFVQTNLPELESSLPLLNDLLPLGFAETDATSAMSPSARQEALADALVALLRHAAAQGPTAIVLEDAHWLDSLSWDFAERLARAATTEGLPLWLLLAHRPFEERHLGERAAMALRGLPDSAAVALGPLDADDVVALVAARLDLDGQRLPSVVADLVKERSNGNPFIAEELLQTLQDQGLLVLEQEGEATVARVSPQLARGEFTLPDTLQGLILSRLDKLGADRQLVLKVAAVIGRLFTMTPLRDTLGSLGWGQRSLKPSLLRELTRRGFVLPEALEPELSYLFRHIITHEIVYQTLLFAQRRQVHRALAEWYEDAFPDVTAELVPVLAHHWRHAAEGSTDVPLVEKAVGALQRAGERAGQLCAYPEAIGYYRYGLDLLAELEGMRAERAELHLRLGEMLERTGAYEAATEHLRRSRDVASEIGGSDVVVQALNWLTTIALRQGDYATAEDLGVEALALAEAAGDDYRAADTRERLGVIAAYRMEFDVAIQRLEAALRYRESIGDMASMQYTLNSLGVTSLFQGDHVAARPYFERALAIARDAGDRDGESRFLTNLGLIAENLGDFDAARERYEASRLISEEIGSRQSVVLNLMSLGDVAVAQARLDDARRDYDRALGGAMEIGAQSLAMHVLCGLARIAVEEEGFDRAARYIGHVLANPATDAEIEQKANPLLERLRGLMKEEAVEAALQDGSGLTLDEMAAGSQRASA